MRTKKHKELLSAQTEYEPEPASASEQERGARESFSLCYVKRALGDLASSHSLQIRL